MTSAAPTLDLAAILSGFLIDNCPSDLKVNPYLEVTPLNGRQGLQFKLRNPIPGKGLAETVASQGVLPTTHALLTRLLMGRASKPVTGGDVLVQELTFVGVLLPPDKVPTRPAFTCTVRDDELASLGNSECTGFPTLLGLQQLPSGHGQLANHEVIWVYDPVRQLKWPYWLTPTQLKRFAEIRHAHSNAGIGDWNRSLREATDSISRTGCAIVRGVLPAQLLRGLQSYYGHLAANGFLPLGDQQSHRFYFHNEPLACWLHHHTMSLVLRLVPEQITPSYTYLGFYLPGAVLKRHTDRDQCDYTLSLTIDMTPSCPAADAWPLYAELKDGTIVQARLGVGDALLFKGRELPHFRHRLADDRTFSSILFHYVPSDRARTVT